MAVEPQATKIGYRAETLTALSYVEDEVRIVDPRIVLKNPLSQLLVLLYEVCDGLSEVFWDVFGFVLVYSSPHQLSSLFLFTS